MNSMKTVLIENDDKIITRSLNMVKPLSGSKLALVALGEIRTSTSIIRHPWSRSTLNTLDGLIIFFLEITREKLADLRSAPTESALGYKFRMLDRMLLG